MSPPDSFEHTIRRFKPSDAPGVVQLVKAVYGDSYYPTDLYDPQRVTALNQERRMVSAVAVNPAGEVVGHYALERSEHDLVAESSDALVLPAYRHHRILEDSRRILESAARELDLVGLVGYPVTNHLYSQKAEEHWGSKPCGIALGLWPRSFHNMPEPLRQRMSFVVYFHRLRPASGVTHVRTRHSSVVERLCGADGVKVTYRDSLPTAADTELEVEFDEPVSSGTIQVLTAGADATRAIRDAVTHLRRLGAKAMMLQLPLDQQGTVAACAELEQDGVFFCGFGPAFIRGRDALLLQWVSEPIDPALVQIEAPAARQLLDYVAAERQRVESQARTA